MLKIASFNGKFILSGFLDKSQDNNITLSGFNNKVFEVFDTLEEAENEKRILEMGDMI
jgi:hypothetical protein